MIRWAKTVHQWFTSELRYFALIRFSPAILDQWIPFWYSLIFWNFSSSADVIPLDPRTWWQRYLKIAAAQHSKILRISYYWLYWKKKIQYVRQNTMHMRLTPYYQSANYSFSILGTNLCQAMCKSCTMDIYWTLVWSTGRSFESLCLRLIFPVCWFHSQCLCKLETTICQRW